MRREYSTPQKMRFTHIAPLYREIRIENELEDGTGQKLRLKLTDEVDVTVEAEKLSTQSEKQAESNENEPTEAKAS